jgi:hypothetical protein
MAIFQYNDVELEISGDDLDLMERYEANLDLLEPISNVSTTALSRVMMLRKFNECLGAFFDAVLGEGTWDEIFCEGQKRSVKEFILCYKELIRCINDESELYEVIEELNKGLGNDQSGKLAAATGADDL